MTTLGLKVIDTTGGFRVTEACADLVGSAADVAFTVTLWAVVTFGGAVYKPEVEMDPTAALSDQVTAVLLLPLTVALNCWVFDAVKVTVAGVIEIETFR